MLNNKLVFTTLFLILIAVTTFLLLIEVKPVPQTWPKDKLEHAIIFALLMYFFAKAYPKYLLYSCIGLAIYGGVMELLQTTLTLTRTGSIADWLADLVGIALGCYAFNLAKN